MQWYTPWALLLLLGLLPLAYIMLRKRRGAAVRFPSLVDMKHCPVSWRQRFRPALVVARLLCLALLILALARPRKGTVLSEVSTEGVAIETVVDRSSSMDAEMNYGDDKLSRLEVVKRVLTDFILGDKEGLGGRSGDLIGLVTFARYADTTSPLVLGHNVLAEFLKDTHTATPYTSEDATAIGDALALAGARLKKAEEELQRRNARLGFGDTDDQTDPKKPAFTIKSKAIILLTDGVNNAGDYAPMKAAVLAKEWGIKVYVIGIGSDQAFRIMNTLIGEVRVPVPDNLDEELLKAIAETTGGFYSRADDAESLRGIVKRINDLEKTEVKSVQYTQYAEHFARWTTPALALLLLEMLAGCTVFRKIP